MKKIILFFGIVFFVSCNNNKSSQKIIIQAANTLETIAPSDIKGAYLKLSNNHYNFGKINRKNNPHLQVDVEFINSGKSPLFILKSDVSCGCMTVEFPKDPIQPGVMKTLRVNIDLHAQKGIFNKTIFIKSNADNDVVLIHIIGEVKK